MKKFYYKKDDTVIEKAPTVLERRNTLSQGGEKDQVESRLSTRTSSLGSLLRDASSSSSSLLPRVQGSREITKCLSEDVLSRGYAKNPGSKVITERELAASKLYKTRKASINSKDSPQKTRQKDDLSPFTLKDPKFKPAPVQPKGRHNTDTSCLFSEQASRKDDLSPVTLKDPKFKPVPVQPKDRRKKESSCLCYLAIFLAISLCTIGILAAVTGFLYGELFSDKNSTSHRLQEAVIDIINLVEDNSSIHEYRVLSGGTLAKVSFENDDSGEIRRSGSNLMVSEDIEFRQMDMSDLGRLLDSKEAEIKFQDRDTTIFEVNANSSAEQKSSIDNIEVIKEETKADTVISEADGHNILNNEHASEETSIIENEKLDETGSSSTFDKLGQGENGGAITNSEQEISDPSTDIGQTQALHVKNSAREMGVPKFDSGKEFHDYRTLNIMKQEIDNLEIAKEKNEENDGTGYTIREVFEVSDEADGENKYIDELLNSANDFSGLDLTSDVNVSDKKTSDGQNDSTSSVSGSELENQPAILLTENTDAVIMAANNISKPSVKLNHINLEYQTKTVSLPKDRVVWKAGDSNRLVGANNESELVGNKEISSENLAADASDKIEHDVEAMLEVISEPGDNVDDPFTVNRNGDVDASGASGLGMKHNLNFLNVKSENGDSSVPLRSGLQSPQEDQMPKEALRTKPLKVMKVSLAEAMKHLQTLDVNNKVLTSRMKPPKPTVQRVKPPKPNDKQRKKENISVDRMQYLHNLRLALQGNLIRL